MHCNKNSDGKFWAIVRPKLTLPHRIRLPMDRSAFILFTCPGVNASRLHRAALLWRQLPCALRYVGLNVLEKKCVLFQGSNNFSFEGGGTNLPWAVLWNHQFIMGWTKTKQHNVGVWLHLSFSYKLRLLDYSIFLQLLLSLFFLSFLWHNSQALVTAA